MFLDDELGTNVDISSASADALFVKVLWRLILLLTTKSSSKPELQREAMDIFQLWFDHNIDLMVDWIPRDLNQTADS